MLLAHVGLSIVDQNASTPVEEDSVADKLVLIVVSELYKVSHVSRGVQDA